jgi:hypothetical protein
MRTPNALLAAGAALVLAACSSPSGGGGATAQATRPSPGRSPAPSTSDSRVRSFLGRPPPEIAPDARWLDGPPAPLASLRGRVVYVQFAFPT